MTAVADTRVSAPERTGSRDLAGTGTLLRLALRRDRIMIPVWALAIGMTGSSTLSRMKSTYETAADRANVAKDMNTNGALRSMLGVAFDDSYGALTAWRVGTFLAAFAGIMSLLIVIRHTREEEESGRQEALSAGMVGRRAGLTSALLTVAIANAAITLLVVATLAGEGSGGALALGLSIGLTGLVFGGLAAVAAQITENARLARGLAAAAVGVAYLLRMAGDAAKDASEGSSHVLVWLSPIGWAENTRPFAQERWWTLLLLAVLAAASFAVAYVLTGRRDVGASFFASRPGPAAAGKSLQGAYGLAWRLQRGTLLGWVVGVALSAAMLGGVANGAGDIVGDSEKNREIIERMGGAQNIDDAFLAAMISLIGVIVTVHTATAVLRLRAEETDQRAEPLLANAVSRLRWAMSHLVIAYLGPVVILAAGGLGAGIVYAAAADDLGGELPRVLGASLAQIPAVWVVTSVVVLLFGLLPSYTTSLGWAVVGVVVAIGWLGPALDAPQAVLDLSPFSHLPKLPGESVSAAPFVWLLLGSAVLTAAGLWGLRRRDMTN
ncbi:ABC transporter membrane-spanning protein [Streptomyces bingchenggensis BCW-1]|uniref:ABC transporter membrane-spanning protein n=1 Tax=Streptomyces bingchenggensis (strain BCW-1) TaxID=749414 RepID=D7CCS1_STRBB|nr:MULTISPECIES: ABC transporter membrane-spanning protein [Streptomyces]ADI08802.1 ABC transporter membrane-spanning protein [Streptomyces bingchenggensis BCW-1]